MEASTVSAIAAASSATVALLAVTVNLWSIRQTGRATDFANCLSVVSQLAGAQRNVLKTESVEEKQFEFRELLNLMEALALLENDERIAPSTQKITEQFLIESWAFIKSQESLKSFLLQSMTDTGTFSELRKFEEQHSKRITDLALHYERQANVLAASKPGDP